MYVCGTLTPTQQISRKILGSNCVKVVHVQHKMFSVDACQRYLCPNVIPMTMNVFIFRNLSLKTVLLNHMSK